MLWIVLELASVAAAAAVFLIVLESAYAAVAAGLTTGAVVLALDSLSAVRSSRDAPASQSDLRYASPGDSRSGAVKPVRREFG